MQQELFFNKEAFLKLMKEHNLNQAGLARKIGVSRACICRYMNGSRTKPSPKVIDGFARAFPEHSITYYFFTQSVAQTCHNGNEKGGNPDELVDG